MHHLLALLHEATQRGFTLGRTLIRLGHTRLEIVVRVVGDGPTT